MPVRKGIRRCAACGYVLPRRGPGPGEILGVAAAAGVLILGVWLFVTPESPEQYSPEVDVTTAEPAPPPPAVAAVPVAAAAPDLKSVIGRAAPSVVRVDVRLRRGVAAGSGFVCGSGGLVITNSHVVAGATEITVLDAGNHRLPARVVADDRAADLALLTVPGLTGAAPLRVISAAGLALGDKVVAIGSPEGLTNSVSEGIVSGLQREIRTESSTIAGAIQTTAPISHGSSGGPLIELHTGSVVGVLFAGSDKGQNLGFAIPGDLVLSTLKKWGIGGA